MRHKFDKVKEPKKHKLSKDCGCKPVVRKEGYETIVEHREV